MKRKNNSTAAWIFTLIAVAGILCGLSESFRNYFEEPHLSEHEQASLQISLLPEPRDLPFTPSITAEKKDQWFGLLVQPAICDALCQGTVTAFEESNQFILKPGNANYHKMLAFITKVGYNNTEGLLLLINKHNQLAGSITAPYSKDSIDKAFDALNR